MMRACTTWKAFIAPLGLAFAAGVAASAAPRVAHGAQSSSAFPAWLLPAVPRIVRAVPPMPSASARRSRSLVGPPLATTPFVIADLGVPAGLSNPMPYAINDRGDVAIQYCPAAGCSATGQVYAYLFDAALHRLIPLARLGSAPVEQYTPHGLNDYGEIVGWVTSIRAGIYTTSPVKWTRIGVSGSQIALLDSTHGSAGYAYAINDLGEVVGTMTNRFYAGLPVRFIGNTNVSLIPPSSLAGSAGDVFAVNDAGVATGDIGGNAAVYTPSGAYFIDLGGGYTDFSAGVSISCAGDVYGFYQTTDPFGLPFGPVGFIAVAANGPAALATTIDYGDDELQIFGANDIGTYVGSFYGGQTVQLVGPFVSTALRGLLLLTDFFPANTSVVPLTATAVNNENQIVGQASSKGRIIAFEMSPAAAPAQRIPASHAVSCRQQRQLQQRRGGLPLQVGSGASR